MDDFEKTNFPEGEEQQQVNNEPQFEEPQYNNEPVVSEELKNMYNEQWQSDPLGEPEKKSRKVPIIIASAAVAVCAVIILAIIFIPKMLMGDREKVLKAVAEVMSAEDPSSVFNYLGIADINKKDTVQASFDISLDNVSEVLGEMPGDLTFVLDYMMDNKNKQLFFDLILGFSGEQVALDFYADTNELQVAMPGYMEGYISAPVKDFAMNFNQSIFGESLQLDEETFGDLNFFDDEEETETTAETDDLYKEYLALYNNMTVEKQTSSKSFNINGKDKTCAAYLMTIKAEDMQKVLERSFEIASVNEIMDEYYASLGLDYDDYKDQVISFFEDDFQLMFYLDGNTLASIQVVDSIDLQGMELDLQIDFTTVAKDNVEFKAYITFSVSGQEIKVVLERTQESTGDYHYSELKGYIEEYDMYSISYTKSYDESDKYFDYLISFDASIAVIEAGLNGTVQDLKKGESFELDFERIYLDAMGEGIDFSGSFSMGPVKDAIEPFSGTKYELFEMDESQIQDLADEINENAGNLEDAVESLY